MTTELIRDVGQIVICLAILAIAAYIQVTTGEIPAPFDTLLLAVVAVLGLGDGVRLVIKRNHIKNRTHHRQEANPYGNRDNHR